MKEDNVLQALALVLLAPKALELANRVIEEYILPGRDLKKAATGVMDLRPVSFDLAISTDEIVKLNEIGALSIIQRGLERHRHILRTGGAQVCRCCQRLEV